MIPEKCEGENSANARFVSTWARGTSQFPAVQQRFETVVASMLNVLDIVQPEINEYAKEKFVKCCKDQVYYLERLLITRKGAYDLKKIEDIMLAQVNRMYRNNIIFLCNCSRKALKGDA